MAEWIACDRCTNRFAFHGMVGETMPSTCKLCEYLGDRALVPLLRDPTPEAVARFMAAPPGHLRFQRETGRVVAPQSHTFRGDPRMNTKGDGNVH